MDLSPGPSGEGRSKTDLGLKKIFSRLSFEISTVVPALIDDGRSSNQKENARDKET